MDRSKRIGNKVFSLSLVVFSVYSFLFFSIGLNALISKMGIVQEKSGYYLIYSALGSLVLYFLFILFLRHFLSPRREPIPTSGPGKGFIILLLILAFFLQFIVSVFFLYFQDLIPPSSSEIEFAELMYSHPWYVLLLALVIAPIFEEIIFRKYVLGILAKDFSKRSAILLSSLLFGAFHLNIRQFLFASLLGFLLAEIAWITGRLSLAIFTHFAFNLFGFVVPNIILLLIILLGEAFFIVIAIIFAILGLINVMIVLKKLRRFSPPSGDLLIETESEEEV